MHAYESQQHLMESGSEASLMPDDYKPASRPLSRAGAAEALGLAALHCAVESLLGGCTAVIDHCYVGSVRDAEAVVAAYRQVGVRIFFAPMLNDDAVQYENYVPVAEDAGLAARSFDGAPGFTCGRLLHACSVCAAGVDCVAVPGDADRARVAGLFLDTAAVAWRLDKPLACRVLPMPGLDVGDEAVFDTDMFLNCRVMDLA